MLILEAYSRFLHLRGRLPEIDQVCYLETNDGKAPFDGQDVMMVAAVILAGDLPTAENDMDLIDSVTRYFGHLHGKLYNDEDLQKTVDEVFVTLDDIYGFAMGEEHGQG